MSNWAEREERERFEAWAEDVGVSSCGICGALVRNWDLHYEWHVSSPVGGTTQ